MDLNSIEKLAELLSNGLISDSEFARLKIILLRGDELNINDIEKAAGMRKKSLLSDSEFEKAAGLLDTPIRPTRADSNNSFRFTANTKVIAFILFFSFVGIIAAVFYIKTFESKGESLEPLQMDVEKNGDSSNITQEVPTNMDYENEVKKLFNAYVPKIEKSHSNDACVKLDNFNILSGQLDHDSDLEYAVNFNLSLCDGGNAAMGSGIAVYDLINGQVKAVAGVDFNEPIGDVAISGGNIVGNRLAYGPDDARCCPSIVTTVKYQLTGSTIQEIP